MKMADKVIFITLYLIVAFWTTCTKCHWSPNLSEHSDTHEITLSNLTSVKDLNSLRDPAEYPLNKVYALIVKDSHIPEISRNTFDLGLNIEKLYLINDNIENLDPYSFAGISNLTEIKIINNSLKYILPETFIGLPKLQILHLCKNEILLLENINVHSLKELHVSHNEISRCNKHSFEDLDQLVTLNLAHNFLYSLDFINELHHLENLNLSFNIFKSISEYDFRKMSSLKTLDLRCNLLNTLGSNLFVHSLNLSHLYLGQNNIDEISNNMFNKSIEYLDLSDNNLSTLPCNQFEGTIILRNNDLYELCEFPKNVTHLDLRNNDISELNPNSFIHLNQLIFLDLSYNYLQTIDVDIFENLNDLQNLSISRIRISELKIGTFRNLKQLISLDISSNYIRNLEHGIFTNLNALKSLDLSDNFLENLSPEILSPLKNLRELYLQRNHLKSEDLNGIRRLIPNLKHLSVSFQDIGCEELADNLNSFSYIMDFEVQQGEDFHTDNVNGIACNPNKEHSPHYMKVVKDILDFAVTFRAIFILILVSFAIVVALHCISLYQKLCDYWRTKSVKKDVENCNVILLGDDED